MVDSLSRILEKRTGVTEELVVVSQVSEEKKAKVSIMLAVKEFFYRQDVSYEFPGMKDYVRVKLPGEKAKQMVKHVLLLTLKETYAEFRKDHPDKELAFSTFATLRYPDIPILLDVFHFAPGPAHASAPGNSTCTCNMPLHLTFAHTTVTEPKTIYPPGPPMFSYATRCRPMSVPVSTTATATSSLMPSTRLKRTSPRTTSASSNQQPVGAGEWRLKTASLESVVNATSCAHLRNWWR